MEKLETAQDALAQIEDHRGDQRRCRLARCNKVLVRQPMETKQNFLSRAFCNRSQAAEFRNEQRKVEHKPEGGRPLGLKVTPITPLPDPPPRKEPPAPLDIEELKRQRMMRGACG